MSRHRKTLSIAVKPNHLNSNQNIQSTEGPLAFVSSSPLGIGGSGFRRYRQTIVADAYRRWREFACRLYRPDQTMLAQPYALNAAWVVNAVLSGWHYPGYLVINRKHQSHSGSSAVRRQDVSAQVPTGPVVIGQRMQIPSLRCPKSFACLLVGVTGFAHPQLPGGIAIVPPTKGTV